MPPFLFSIAIPVLGVKGYPSINLFAVFAARIAPPLQFVVVLFGMKKAPCKPFEIYAELKLAGGAGHKEDMAGHFS